MMPDSPVLELIDMMAAGPPPGPDLGPVSLRLAAGRWMRLRFGSPTWLAPFADTILGLVPPEAGRVLFEGADWENLGADEAAQRRARIGRVFADTAWLANLDVDENVLLGALYHTRHGAGELRAEAEALARRLGLDGLPSERPARTPAATLRIAQWVRALLMGPRLLVLEDPMRGAAPAEIDALGAVLLEQLNSGAAMLWLDAHSGEPPAALLPPATEMVVPEMGKESGR